MSSEVRARAVVVLLTLLAWPLAAAAAAAPPKVDGGLTFTRPDGTGLAFGTRFRIRCGPWEPDVPVRTIHVVAGVPGSGTFWLLSAVLADVLETVAGTARP